MQIGLMILYDGPRWPSRAELLYTTENQTERDN